MLAFFPGAFTPPCSNEMVALQSHLDGDGAVVYERVADDPTNEPEYEELLGAVRAA